MVKVMPNAFRENRGKFYLCGVEHRGFFMGPSARSAPDWKTERRRSEVCKEDAVQRYPDLSRGDLKNFISFSVEIDSVKLPIPTMIDRLLMHYISNMFCHQLFFSSKHAPVSRTPGRFEDNKKNCY